MLSSPVSRLLDTGSIPPVVRNTTSPRSTAKRIRAECRIELSTHHNPDDTERSRTVASQPLAPARASSAAAFLAPQLAAENSFRDSRKTIGAGGLGCFVFVVVVWCQRRKTRGRFQAGDVSHSPSPSPSQSHCHRPGIGFGACSVDASGYTLKYCRASTTWKNPAPYTKEGLAVTQLRLYLRGEWREEASILLPATRPSKLSIPQAVPSDNKPD